MTLVIIRSDVDICNRGSIHSVHDASALSQCDDSQEVQQDYDRSLDHRVFVRTTPTNNNGLAI